MSCMFACFFESIPVACWWAVSTLTSIDYGDVMPTSLMGRNLASLTAMFSVMALCFTSAFIVVSSKDLWAVEKAKSAIRRHCRHDVFLKQELDVVENLLSKFQNSLDEVLSKMEECVYDLDQDERGHMAFQILAMLKSHSVQISSEVDSYVCELCFTARERTVLGKVI